MIKEIINVAGKFIENIKPLTLASKSTYRLIKEIGCLDSSIQINEIDVYNELLKCPECIMQWVEASGNQKDGDSWHFGANTNGKYWVSRLANENENRSYQQTIYTDGNKACANFITHLIEYYKELYQEGV